jgi:hypothetical protein
LEVKFYCFVLEHYVAQAGLELLISSGLPTSAQVAGTTNVL